MIPGTVPLQAAPLPPPPVGGGNVIPGPWAPMPVPPAAPAPLPPPMAPPLINNPFDPWLNPPEDRWGFWGAFDEEIFYRIDIRCRAFNQKPAQPITDHQVVNVRVKGPLKGVKIVYNAWNPIREQYDGWRAHTIGKNREPVFKGPSSSTGVKQVIITYVGVVPEETLSNYKKPPQKDQEENAPPEDRTAPAPAPPQTDPAPDTDSPGESDPKMPPYIPWVPPPHFDPDDPSTWPEQPDPGNPNPDEDVPPAPSPEPPPETTPAPKPKPRPAPPTEPGAPPRPEPVPPAEPERPEVNPEEEEVKIPQNPEVEPPLGVPQFPEIPEEITPPIVPELPEKPEIEIPTTPEEETPKIPWPLPATPDLPFPTPNETGQDRPVLDPAPAYQGWDIGNILKKIADSLDRLEQSEEKKVGAPVPTLPGSGEEDDKNRKVCRLDTKNRQAILPQTDDKGNRKVLDIIDWQIIGAGEFSSWQRRIQPVYDALYEAQKEPPAPPSTPESYEINVNNDVPVLVLQYGAYKVNKWLSTSRQITLPNPHVTAFNRIKHHLRTSGNSYAALKLADGKRIVVYDATESLALARARQFSRLVTTPTVSTVTGTHRQGLPQPLSLRAVLYYPEGRRNQKTPTLFKYYRPNGTPDPRYHPPKFIP